MCIRDSYEEDIISLREKRFPVLGDGADIEREILEAAREGDSVGGVLETAVINMPDVYKRQLRMDRGRRLRYT